MNPHPPVETKPGSCCAGAHLPAEVGPASAVDPVCGMTVSTDNAKSSVHHGTVYYFCSAEHRDQFEADPERYTGTSSDHETKEMEHSHG